MTESDAPRLSPGEIAYRDFARASDGLREDEVRAFLNEVADVVAAARDRELRLEERVVELEEQLDASRTAPGGGGAAGGPADPRAQALFARLREQGDAAAAKPEPPRKTTNKSTPKPAPAPQSTSKLVTTEPEPTEEGPAPEPPALESPASESPASEPSPDEGIRAQRDAVLESLIPDLARAAKRLLQDEQNLLLDAARRARARIEADRLLPDPAEHSATWAALLASGVDAAYTGGRNGGVGSGKTSNAPDRVLNDLAVALIAPLRERLATTLAAVAAEGPYESAAELHRELASAVGARYREWRATDLEVRLEDTVAAAYARGAYDGAPSGAHLRWVTDAGQRCPDCEDNSLEPTVKGQAFPTGQPHPPAHPGCRCLVVVVAP